MKKSREPNSTNVLIILKSTKLYQNLEKRKSSVNTPIIRYAILAGLVAKYYKTPSIHQSAAMRYAVSHHFV